MSKYKAIVEELARTALNIPAGELQELVKKTEEEITDDEVKVISEKLKTKYRDVITSINKTAELNANKLLDDKFKAGQRTKAEEIEKALKEKFAVDSDKTGQELIDDIVEQANKKTSSKGDKITEDDVKKHAAFLRMETEYKNQLKKVKDESDAAINKLKADQSRKEVFSNVSKKAMEIFDEMNPVLSDDPKKAAAQRQILLRELEGYDYEEIEGKLVVSKEGKRIENEFKHAIDFEQLVKEKAEAFFDFKKATDRRAPNSGAGGGSGSDGSDKDKSKHIYKGNLPKTEAEYQKMMDDDNIPIKDRMAINDHWAKQQETASAN